MITQTTQQQLEDVDARLEKAMQKLGETALEVKAERDKYADALWQIRQECQHAQNKRRDLKNRPPDYANLSIDTQLVTVLEMLVDWIVEVTDVLE